MASMKPDRCIAMEPMEPPITAGPAPWLTLTGLGRIYGISAVHCGRLLSDAGLRDHDGQPSLRALDDKLAYQRHPHHGSRHALWQRQGCSAILEAGGLVPEPRDFPLADVLDPLVAQFGVLEESSQMCCCYI